jgi:hypothetical protein
MVHDYSKKVSKFREARTVMKMLEAAKRNNGWLLFWSPFERQNPESFTTAFVAIAAENPGAFFFETTGVSKLCIAPMTEDRHRFCK